MKTLFLTDNRKKRALESFQCERQITTNSKAGPGIPWQSGGEDSVLSLLKAWVQSLIGELRSCKLGSMAEKKSNCIGDVEDKQEKN